MAMNIGSSSTSGEPEMMMEINTTPLIDVMLVLLVMLIITIPIQLHSVNMDLPVGTPPQNTVKPEEISIDIDAQNLLYWQGVTLSAKELEDKMAGISAQSPQPVVKIHPNKDAQYAVFANVLASSKRKGLTRMAVIGAEQFVE